MISWSGQHLIFPFYHLVSNESPAHIKHLYPIRNIQAFENDLDYLLKHFQIIHPEELKRKDYFPSNAFLLTFDDGLREFYDIIAPILLRKGVPAICFLNSAFIDNKDLFFRYKASLLIEDLSKLPYLLESSNLPDWIGQNNFKQVISQIDYHEKDQLDIISAAIDKEHPTFESYLQNKQPYMTSKQIKELVHKGFYFGGHSIDHPLYHDLPLEEQWRQTSESITFIKEQFDLDTSYFAFPFTDFQVSKALFEMLQEHGITSFGTAGLKNEAFSNHFQRIPMEIGEQSVQEILKTEYLYYLLKRPFGKNRMHRV